MLYKFSAFILSLLLVSVVSSQNLNSGERNSMDKGNLIIENARKKIGTDKIISNVNSFKYSTRRIMKSVKNTTTIETEVAVTLPNKMYSVFAISSPFESKTISIWNEERYKKTSEIVTPDGKRTVRDITDNNPINSEKLNMLKGKIDKEKLEQLKKLSSIKQEDPKQSFINQIWTDFFPLVLIHPFEQNLNFKYVGKAESNNRIADVVDVVSQNGRTYRLFFDAKTSYLIMMIEEHEETTNGFDAKYERKYYFSEWQKINEAFIPKTIKIEIKSTPKEGETKTSYEDIEIIDFKLNPDLKDKMFDIK